MLEDMQHRPNSNPLKPLLRLRNDYFKLKGIAEFAWVSEKAKSPKPELSPDELMEKRKEKFFTVFSKSPYIFIVGASGIGKSTFVQKKLKDAYGENITITEGLDKLNEWIKNTDNNKEKILFIDEANLLAPGALAIFEGLFSNPPKLLIDGTLRELSPNHKVIFAGNFGNFKGRQQHELFTQHGRVIQFKEWPDTFLKEKIIHPEIVKLLKNVKHEELENVFLSAYHYINELLPDTHPATARNLQMMVLQFEQLQKQLPKLTVTETACMAAYEEMSGLLNREQQKKLKTFLQKQFQADIKAIKTELKSNVADIESDKFFTTKKRVNPIRILNNLFAMRDTKLKSNEAMAVNGLLLEGDPGIGKSLMAIEYLKSQGFQDGNLSPHTDKLYYHLTPTDPIKMRETLEKAFHAGAVVIIDEINTMSLESILNPLLSGVDSKGAEATKPGFFVIGTQNPISFDKRQVFSTALLNRFKKLDLKNYEKEDLETIVNKIQGNPSKDSEKLVDDYLAAREYAKQHNKSPEPTPRDLFSSVSPKK
jgi:hypothetical protein